MKNWSPTARGFTPSPVKKRQPQLIESLDYTPESLNLVKSRFSRDLARKGASEQRRKAHEAG